jgi:peroxiredoxin
MLRRHFFLIGLISLCAFGFILVSHSLADDEKSKDAIVGQAAPALVTSTLDGKSFDLSTLKDKVVVIHFWATWCAPCQEEMPALEAVWRHDHGKGLEVLAISADRPRARGDVDQVMHIFTFPVALLTNLSKNGFGIPTAIPVTYIIDKTGNVATILTPETTPLTEQSLSDVVKPLLDAKSDVKIDTKQETKSDTKTDTKP